MTERLGIDEEARRGIQLILSGAYVVSPGEAQALFDKIAPQYPHFMALLQQVMSMPVSALNELERITQLMQRVNEIGVPSAAVPEPDGHAWRLPTIDDRCPALNGEWGQTGRERCTWPWNHVGAHKGATGVTWR